MFNPEENKFQKFENKVWLSSPTMYPDSMHYVMEAYETNWMSTVGANINEIEVSVCKKIGCKYSVALSAGTAALHLAMKLAGEKMYGKPVIGTGVLHNRLVAVSDMTFDATVNPIVYEGGIPVFVDTEYDTWNMDPVALENTLTQYPEIKVVVIAHLYGTPGKIDELREICSRHSTIIIEDAAESFGASYKGKQTGVFGAYNVISFNGNKIITGSSGGMLLTDSKVAAEKVRKWSTQSRECAAWYQHEELGYNYRMSNGKLTYVHNFMLEIMLTFGSILGVCFLIWFCIGILKILFYANREVKCLLLALMSQGFFKLFVSGSFIIEPMFYACLGIVFHFMFGDKSKHKKRGDLLL